MQVELRHGNTVKKTPMIPYMSLLHGCYGYRYLNT